jgi:hypothetical protein
MSDRQYLGVGEDRDLEEWRSPGRAEGDLDPVKMSSEWVTRGWG